MEIERSSRDDWDKIMCAGVIRSKGWERPPTTPTSHKTRRQPQLPIFPTTTLFAFCHFLKLCTSFNSYTIQNLIITLSIIKKAYYRNHVCIFNFMSLNFCLLITSYLTRVLDLSISFHEFSCTIFWTIWSSVQRLY